MRAISFLLIIGLFIYKPLISSETHPYQNQRSLSEILNEDGTISMDAPSGSYSAMGYELASGEDEEPVFFKSAGSNDGWTDPYTYKGVNNYVYAVVKHGSYIYIGGSFTNAGGNPNADYIAYWTGDQWLSLGSTPLNGTVYAMASDGSSLYVGGTFYNAGGNSNADRIAKWTGSSWQALGSGVNHYVYAIAISGTDVYIGGYFTDVAGIAAADKVAKWNGSSWSACGTPSFTSTDWVYALAVGENGDNNIYVGGDFDSYGGNIARFYPGNNNWYNLGVGVGNGVVYTIEYDHDATYYMYIGGTFTDAQGANDANPVTEADRIARVYATGITYALGTGLSSTVYDIEKIDGNVYAAGYFTNAGGDAYADRIAIWDGSSWSAVNDEYISSYIRDIEIDGSSIYAGGAFTAIDGEAAYRIAKYDGSHWGDMASSFGSYVYAVAVDSDGDIYVGGSFYDANGLPEGDRIIRYDVSSSTWVACGGGLSSTVYDIAINGLDVYVGGAFSNAGGNTNADKVAKYNKSTDTWSALTTSYPLNSTVYALDYHTHLYSLGLPPNPSTFIKRLYIGGAFTNAGNNANADYLCYWNDGATSFSAIGSTPLNNYVRAIEGYGGLYLSTTQYLYIGGDFTDAFGNTSADYFARIYSTGAVYSMGTFNGSVRAIKYVNSENLYVGGYFTNVGNSYGDRIVKYNGSSWESLNTGVSSYVHSIEASGNNIFIGGSFSNAGGDIDADRIAYWDGKAWIPIGTGTNSTVYSIALHDNKVYAGGAFTKAGDITSEYFAQYAEMPVITSSSPTSDQTKCEGESLELTVSATGSGLSYQWLRNGAVFSSSSTVNFSSLSPGDAGTIECKVSNVYGHVYSTAFDLTVRALPNITTQPSNDRTCEDGGAAYFAVGATGYNLNYQWQRKIGSGSWVDIESTNSPDDGCDYREFDSDELEVDGPPYSMNNYYYRCIVTNECDSVGDISSSATLYVSRTTEMTEHPEDDDICPGDDGYFYAEAIGYNNQYQWQVNDGGGSWINVENSSVYSGANNVELEIHAPDASYSGYQYRCVADGDCGDTSISGTATLTILEEVTISTQPSNAYACENSSAVFTVVATGSNITYWWYTKIGSSWTSLSDNATYSGTHTNTLTINATDDLHSRQYMCLVQSSCDYQWTTAKTLYVLQAPEITMHPVNDTICANTLGEFSVEATGYGTLTYQWRVSADDGATWNNAGTNSPVYNFTADESNDGYLAKCVVAGDCSPFTVSDSAELHVKPNPVITTHPSGTSVCEGETAYFSAIADDATDYQWQRTTDGVTWVNLTGAITTTISISGVDITMDGYEYRCIAMAECSNDTSNAAELTVNEAPVITTEPTDQDVCLEGPATFTLAATGYNLTYQWQLKIPGFSWDDLSGETGTSYTIASVAAGMDLYEYRCIVTGDCDPADTSNVVQVDIRESIDITYEPEDKTIATGGGGSLEFEVSGYELTFQWERIDDSKTGSWENVPENSNFSNTDSVNLVMTNATTSMGDSLYRCIITDGCGFTDTTNEVNLDVASIPEITSHPEDVSLCPGNNNTFSVTATGTITGYQWQVNEGAGFGDISGATSNTYQVTSVDTSMSDNLYRCVVSGSGGDAVSDYAKLTVKNDIEVISYSDAQTACEGDDLVFEVVATGDGLSYEWFEYYDFTDHSIGGNSAMLELNSISADNDGYGYKCSITGDCGSKTAPATGYIGLYVNTTPEIFTQPVDKEVCEGGTQTFSIVPVSTVDAYQWQINDGDIWTNIINSNIYSGAETNTLSIDSAIIELDSAEYRCLLTNDCGNSISDTVLLDVLEDPVIIEQPVTAEICEGDDTLFAVAVSGYDTTFKWEYSTDGNSWSDVTDGGIYSGATNDTLFLSSVPFDNNSYIYRCVITNNTCATSVTTNEMTLTVNAAPAISLQPVDATVCEGGDSVFTVEATGTVGGYQWYVDDGGGWAALSDADYYNGTTTNSLTVSGADLSIHNNAYRCEVTAVCGSDAVSNSAYILVNQSPEITSEPVNVTVCEGIDTLLSVGATGDNLNFKWEVNSGGSWTDVIESADIIGADNDTLFINNITSDLDNNEFRCIVTGDCEPVDTSRNALVRVNVLPMITYFDSDTALCEGNEITFKAKGTSDLSITYQWKLDGAEIAGETDSLLIIDSLEFADGGTYSCDISNQCGPVDSSLILTVYTLPVIDLGEDMQLCAGDTAELTAPGAITYLWSNDSTSQNIYALEDGLYEVTITDANACSNSDSINISFSEPYADQEIGLVTEDGDGNNIITWDRAEDTTIISYEIHRAEGAGSFNYIATVPADSGLNQYIDTNVSTDHKSYSYKISIIDTCGNESEYSESHSTMRLYITKSGNSNVLNWNEYSGADYTSFIIYRGTAIDALSILDYASIESDDYLDISPPVGEVFYQIGVDIGDTIHIDSLGTDIGEYFIAKSNIAKFSRPITEFIADKTEILIGDSIQFTDQSENIPTAWNWIFEGGNADSRFIQNPNVNYNVAGTYDVTLTASNSYGDSMLVKEDYIKVVGLLNKSTTICYGDSVELSINSDTYSYTWSTGVSDQPITVKPETSTYYKVSITNSTTVVDSVYVQVIPKLELGEDLSICKGDSAIIDPEIYVTYNWNNGESAADTFKVITTDTVYLSVSHESGCDFSDSIIVNVNNLPQFDLGSDQTVCYGEVITLDAGSGYSYNWNTGDNSQTLDADTTGIYIVTVTNEHNCQKVDSVSIVTIVPYDGQEIFAVMTDTSEVADTLRKNMIVWPKIPDAGIDSFRIYKETSVAGEYKALATLSYDKYNRYIDETSDPKTKSAKYKISVIDSCGNESALSQHHKTIVLLSSIWVQGGDTSINLNWNHYEGFEFGTYSIYFGTSKNDMQLLDQIASTDNIYKHNDPPYGDLYYQIVVERDDTLELSGSQKASAGPYSRSSSNIEDNRLKIEGGDNEAPTDISLSNNTINENVDIGYSIGILSTTDPDLDDTHTYTFETGDGDDDNGSFYINGDIIESNEVFDFEIKPTYNIRIKATDKGGKSFAKQFVINVLDIVEDVNEAPINISLTNNIFDENQSVGTPIGVFITQDPDTEDTHTYTFETGIGDDGNGSFYIGSDTLYTNEVFDYESAYIYSIRIKTTDQDDSSFTKNFTVYINNVQENNAPTNIIMLDNNIYENQPVGTAIGTFTTEDGDIGDAHVYTLVAGPGDDYNDSCTVSNDTLYTNWVFDYENTQEFNILVRSTDDSSAYVEMMISLNVNDINEIGGNLAPTVIMISNNAVDENSPKNSFVGEFSTIDPDIADTHTYEFVSGSGSDDNDKFVLDGDSLLTDTIFKYEEGLSYNIRVKSTDGEGASKEKQFVIYINNVVNTPTDILLSVDNINENNAIGDTVCVLSPVDADSDDSHYYLLISGEGSDDNISFSISDSLLIAEEAFDFESQDTYLIRIRTIDGDDETFEKSFEISINDISEGPVNHAPTAITLLSDTIVENNAIGDVIGVLSTTDEDVGDEHIYYLVVGEGGDDNISFSIDKDSLKASESFNFEEKDTYSIRIRSRDSSNAYIEQQFTISIIDDIWEDNIPPSEISLSSNVIYENKPLNTLVGQFTTTDDNLTDTHIYTFTDGVGDDDNSGFVIDDDSLRSNAIFDFETKSSYSIRIKTTDPAGTSFEKQFTIIILDVDEETDNHQPTGIILSNNFIEENLAVGTVVGDLTTSDPDEGDTHTYSLVEGEGGDDNSSFVINGASLRSTVEFDYETKVSYFIRVRTIDQGDLSYDEQLTIYIVDDKTDKLDQISAYNNYVTIWPNPFKHQALIALKNKLDNINAIKLYNATGSLIKSYDDINSNSFMLHKKDLAPGLYYVKVISTYAYYIKVTIQ